MRRFVSFLIVLSLLPMMLLASDVSTYMYTIGSNTFYAEFKQGNENKYTGIDINKTAPQHGSDYNDDDILGIVGVAAFDQAAKEKYITGKTFTVRFELLDLLGNASSDAKWVALSQSNTTLEIPFGLQFVLRYNTFDSTDGKTGQFANTQSGLYSLGYARNGGLNNDGEMEFTIKPGTDWSAFWIDIILVVPDSWAGMNYGDASDYHADMKLTVESDGIGDAKVSDNFSMALNGYYNLKDSEGMNQYVAFSVIPYGEATNIHLSSLSGGDVVIGSFSYETSSIRTSSADKGYNQDTISCPLYMYVSSSDIISNESTGQLQFYLHHEKASENNDAEAVNIPFSIGLRSKLTGTTVWYDGDENTSIENKRLKGKFEYSPTRLGLEDVVILRDDGDILFKLGHVDSNGSISDDEVMANYVSGNYSSPVYIHLYTEW